MATSLAAEHFQYVYVVDTELVALPGEQQRPVCLVARGFNQGRDVELFFDRPAPSPFADPANTLFLGYNLSAEFQTMLSLGWTLPGECVDLYVEFLNMINGVWRGAQSLRDLGTRLPHAVTHFGGNPLEFWKADKDAERRYIIDNGALPPLGVSLEAHRRRILTYCREDVEATVWLGQRMLSEIDLNQALWRGRYTKANAWFQHNGLPVDLARFRAVEQQSDKLKISIAKEIESAHSYGVYVIQGGEGKKEKPHPVFKMDQFHRLLTSRGIIVGGKHGTWKATPTGDPMLEDDYFSDMCKVYPDLEPLRQCRKSINSLSRFGTVLGQDGFNRAPLWMFGTVTGRNNPKAKHFLLSRPHWSAT